jgi:hypothetical protein
MFTMALDYGNPKITTHKFNYYKLFFLIYNNMNNYKNYLQNKNSSFHQTEKNILNLLNSKDLKNKDHYLSSKVKNRLIDSLLYLHQYKPNCEIRKKFRKKYNLEMSGGKKEIMKFTDIINPMPTYGNSDLEKQFQEISKNIFKNQNKYVYPDGDSKFYQNIPEYDFGYKIDTNYQKKKQKQEQENYILEFLRSEGKNISDRNKIFNKIENTKFTKDELIQYCTGQGLSNNFISYITNLKSKDLEKNDLKKDLQQINQLTDIVNESKYRTSINLINTANQDLNNDLMRQEMTDNNNLIFDSISDYNLEFINLNTKTNEKCKYKIKYETSKKNNVNRDKYKDYQKYDDILSEIKNTKMKNGNYDIKKLINLKGTTIYDNNHSELYSLIELYQNSEKNNTYTLNQKQISKLNTALLGLQLFYDLINNIKISNITNLNLYFNKKLNTPGVKYDKLEKIIDSGTLTMGSPARWPITKDQLLRIDFFKDDILLFPDKDLDYDFKILESKEINSYIKNNKFEDGNDKRPNLDENYINYKKDGIPPTKDDCLENIMKLMKFYSYLVRNNNKEIKLENLEVEISNLIEKIINKDDLLKEIDNSEESCKLNTECQEDNLCHQKKCIYEALAASGNLKGKKLTGLEIRNIVQQKFPKIYSEYKDKNFISDCDWLDGKIINFLEQEFKIRIILINKFDYNFNQELIEYNDYLKNKGDDLINNTTNKKEKGTIENLDEIKNIKNRIKKNGINYLKRDSTAKALQSKFSVMNKQGGILCNNLKQQKLKNYNKVVFIIYNTDENYQLLKINNKIQMSISEVPFNLKNFVNKSCGNGEQILQISEQERIENKIDYELIENKILDFFYTHKVSKDSEKINYFRNLINLYMENDDIIKINDKLKNQLFTLDDDNTFSTILNTPIDISNYKYLLLEGQRNSTPVPADLKIAQIISKVHNSEKDENYISEFMIDSFNLNNNKLIIKIKTIPNKSVDITKTYYKPSGFKFQILNQYINEDFLIKLIDLILYMDNKKNDVFIGDISNNYEKNIYLKIIIDNLYDKESFFELFQFYLKYKIEELGNYNQFNQLIDFNYLYQEKLFDLLQFIEGNFRIGFNYIYNQSNFFKKIVPTKQAEINNDFKKLNSRYQKFVLNRIMYLFKY